MSWRWILRGLVVGGGAIGVLAVNGMALGASSPRYPERPVRLVLPFSPGGGSDAVARIVAPKLHEAMGQPWVVDNRPGAAGNIATEIVAHAEPDGYTVLLGFSTALTVNPTLYEKMNFNIEKDFRPVINITAGQYMLVLHPSVKANSVKELIEYAKANPGKLRYASAGIGSPLFLSAELFQNRAGVKLLHVPYKGGGPAAASVVSGETHMIFGSLPSSFPHVKAGRLKALAVTGPKRANLAPDIPTIAELGFPGFEVTSWYGLLVPTRTPNRVVRIIHEETRKVMQIPEVEQRLSRLGLWIDVRGPNEFAARVKAETSQWAKLMKEAGVKPK